MGRPPQKDWDRLPPGPCSRQREETRGAGRAATGGEGRRVPERGDARPRSERAAAGALADRDPRRRRGRLPGRLCGAGMLRHGLRERRAPARLAAAHHAQPLPGPHEIVVETTHAVVRRTGHRGRAGGAGQRDAPSSPAEPRSSGPQAAPSRPGLRWGCRRFCARGERHRKHLRHGHRTSGRNRRDRRRGGDARRAHAAGRHVRKLPRALPQPQRKRRGPWVRDVSRDGQPRRQGRPTERSRTTSTPSSRSTPTRRETSIRSRSTARQAQTTAQPTSRSTTRTPTGRQMRR